MLQQVLLEGCALLGPGLVLLVLLRAVAGSNAWLTWREQIWCVGLAVAGCNRGLAIAGSNTRLPWPAQVWGVGVGSNGVKPRGWPGGSKCGAWRAAVAWPTKQGQTVGSQSRDHLYQPCCLPHCLSGTILALFLTAPRLQYMNESLNPILTSRLPGPPSFPTHPSLSPPPAVPPSSQPSSSAARSGPPLAPPPPPSPPPPRAACCRCLCSRHPVRRRRRCRG